MGRAEGKIEKYLNQEITKLGGFTRKFAAPGRRGVPDRICFLYRFIILIEVKTETGVLSKLQQRELNRLTLLEIPHAVVTSKQAVDELIALLKSRGIGGIENAKVRA